jgi:hypothetical protein
MDKEEYVKTSLSARQKTHNAGKYKGYFDFN